MRYLIAAIALYGAFRLFKKGYDMTQDQELYLAKTMWGEARGEGARGMQAVGNVVMNRVNAGSWYGASVKDVVLKPWQFSCWNFKDPNRIIIENMTAQQLAANGTLAIAHNVISGKLPDITGGATHYHNKNITPYWVSKMKKTAQIGNHIFYREV